MLLIKNDRYNANLNLTVIEPFIFNILLILSGDFGQEAWHTLDRSPFHQSYCYPGVFKFKERTAKHMKRNIMS